MRQTGGHGQYAHCVIEIAPREPGSGYEFVNKIVGGVIPKEFIAPIDQGIREAAQSGLLSGHEVVDFSATLLDGSYHEVDSSEMAFKIAGSMAFKDALAKADCALLEPMMKIEVVVPDEYMGDVLGDITRPPRPRHRHGHARRAALHRRPCAALGDVRLRHRPALQDAGARHLYHAVCPLRRGSHQYRRQDSRQKALI